MGVRVDLTDDELILLDGNCSEKVQGEVDKARGRTAIVAARPDLDPSIAALVADVVSEAKQNGRVVWVNKRARHCRACKKSAGYVKFKSGPRKGQANYDKPVTFDAVEMAYRFVTIQNHLTLGCCLDCAKVALPELVAALADVRAEVPERLAAPGRPLWRCYGLRRCPDCGWEGHEGELRQLPTLMRDGTFPGGCPSCPFESGFMRKSWEHPNGHEVVPA